MVDKTSTNRKFVSNMMLFRQPILKSDIGLMSFSELDHLAEALLTELGVDLEPTFIRQSEVVKRNDACTALQQHLESVRNDQSALELLDGVLNRQLDELEQSISALERFLVQVFPPGIIGRGTLSPVLWDGNMFCRNAGIRFPMTGVVAERRKFYHTLSRLPCWMGSLERDLLPQITQLNQEIDDHRSSCEKICPILEVMAHHTKILLAVEKNLNAIDNLLAANRARFLDFGLGGEKDMGDFFAALSGKKFGQKFV
ncbi:uncharacterized protein LOC131681079 [Topomyia yanbarensis]|uniref:uncharacterized protein LOC131681079 n=1 Tax=Topomyia yanbarensis TaxID=2498891 RepID=UPI00273BB313|nr:uncharacterized protein LOC131681079 [Topomyia yanbarensis]